MTLPDNILEYLQTFFLETRRPFCITVDAGYVVQQVWGYSETLGAGEIQPEADMLQHAPFLLGQLGRERRVLPFVTMANSNALAVHIIPDKSLHYVLMLDAKEEHDYRQQRQQITNENRLLHVSQQKLISRQRDLISDLVEAKAELDHRRREAERNNDSKSRFIALMSHEFRTPLASIINYADLALEESVGTQDIRKSNEAIGRASRHLTMLVDSILDDARMDAGNVQLREQPFDLRSLVDDMAMIMAPLAAEKGLSFTARAGDGVPEFVHADDACLRQILVNVLGNAVKYTEDGGVSLSVSWDQDVIRASVVDTGPGIKNDDQERIFRPYERGDDAARTATGSGLGLAISLDLARLMRGRIELESTAGSGCTVTITVPAPAADRQTSTNTVLPEPAMEHYASRPSSVLLCDDDEDMLALAEFYLHRAGYGLLLARDGLEAVEKALAYKPDLILMDINTPNLSGSEATTRLRESGFYNPIVALTASDISSIDNTDFTAFLRKPIKMPELLAQIKHHLAQDEATRNA